MIGLPDGQRLPIAQVIQHATVLHQAGRIRKAAELYRCILAKVPRHADALHLLGLTERQLGNLVQAVELLHLAIAANPRVAIFHSNLGEIYRAEGHLAQSEAACRRALELDPLLPEAHLNLGGALLLQQDFDGALAAYARCLAMRPGSIDALLGQGDALLQSNKHAMALERYQQVIDCQPGNAAALTRMGIVLRKQGRIDEGIRHYEAAIRRYPTIPELHNNLAGLYQHVGRIDDAIASLRKLLELTPGDDTARHLLASLQGTTTARAPAGYVRDVFDGYAENFEAHLVQKLGYQIPSRLGQVLKQCWGRDARVTSVLDMGCGTGLFGAEISDVCSRLVGVDIAPKMIQKASEKGIYTELHTGDLMDFLRAAETASYDAVAATDVFIYLGDLGEIFGQVRRLLRPGGLFGFSVESLADAAGNFMLDTTGRYRQSAAYLDALAKQNGLASAHFAEVTIRHQ